jgi:hypothetical protein
MTGLDDRVRVLLRSLGTTADEIADSLRQRGITGLREDGCRCPIANVIRAEIPESRDARWDDADGAWFACGSYVSTPDGRVFTPAGIDDFIHAFDNGCADNDYSHEYPYSDLEER